MFSIRYIPLFIFLLTLFGCNYAQNNSSSQTKFLNLDFEKSTADGSPLGWFTGGKGFIVSFDSSKFYSGKRSLKISRISSGRFGGATSSFPVDAVKGKKMIITAYIKTQNVMQGYAILWCRIDGENNAVLNYDNSMKDGGTGTSDWKKYSIKMDVSNFATNINFGVLLSGSGTAWFDDLNILVNGKEYKQVVPKPFISSSEQLSWIKNNALSFDTSKPGNDLQKLAGLKQIIGNARIISLGEGTHGTSEFFNMKDRIVRYVAKQYGNVVFAMEANMPEAKRINDYITTGKGDPKTLLAGLYFWTWDTQEVLDMIKWMRRYNASKNGKIEFWGFDLQTPNVALKNVEKFIKKYDGNYIDSVNLYYKDIPELYATIRRNGYNFKDDIPFAKRWLSASVKVLNHLIQNRNHYIRKIDSSKVDWIIQNAVIIKQGADMYIPDHASRDESMALNTEWIIDHAPKSYKIVLWAHNGHVSKTDHKMGNFLSKKYGNSIVNFGFAFYSGAYTAIGNKGLSAYVASDAEPGSIEWALHATGMKRMILDLRKVSNKSDSQWLKQNLLFRSIGAFAMDNAFYPTIITNEYDVLIFFDNSTPSHLLSNKNYNYDNFWKKASFKNN